MSLEEFGLRMGEVFISIVKYGFPTIAIIISILSYIDSRKSKRDHKRISDIEEKLRNYELQEKENEINEATKACIEVRVINIAKNIYKMKIWNSGKSTAYNVDFKVQEDCKKIVGRDKVPYEFLEPGKSFEENVFMQFGYPQKFTVITSWTDRQRNPFSKEQIVTI